MKSHVTSAYQPEFLFAGELDAQRYLFNLHRRDCPTQALHEKADEFIDNVCQRSDEYHESRLYYFRSYHSLAEIINEEKSG